MRGNKRAMVGGMLKLAYTIKTETWLGVSVTLAVAVDEAKLPLEAPLVTVTMGLEVARK